MKNYFNGSESKLKNKFDSIYELFDNFCNYLSISRCMKRKLIFDCFYVNDELVLLDDYLILKELFSNSSKSMPKGPVQI